MASHVRQKGPESWWGFQAVSWQSHIFSSCLVTSLSNFRKFVRKTTTAATWKMGKKISSKKKPQQNSKNNKQGRERKQQTKANNIFVNLFIFFDCACGSWGHAYEYGTWQSMCWNLKCVVCLCNLSYCLEFVESDVCGSCIWCVWVLHTLKNTKWMCVCLCVCDGSVCMPLCV